MKKQSNDKPQHQPDNNPLESYNPTARNFQQEDVSGKSKPVSADENTGDDEMMDAEEDTEESRS